MNITQRINNIKSTKYITHNKMQPIQVVVKENVENENEIEAFKSDLSINSDA